ncbi:MAG: TetR/AcrR family transcriptional regulator [Solobacterium sp.]|nr:TetR/AcrR family transcriptional regulator [Solobacterium sp.]
MAKKMNTKEKVLKAASRVFSENGYKETTVRMISEKAGVNVASVNYYFGDKEQLYLEVIRFWAKDAFRDFPAEALSSGDLTPEEKIRQFIYYTLLCLLGKDGKGTGFGRLMALEASISPSGVVHQVITETIQQPTEQLYKAVSQMLSTDDEDRIKAYTAAIVGQTVYFYLAKDLISDLFGIRMPASKEEIQKLGGYLADFAIKAVTAA